MMLLNYDLNFQKAATPVMEGILDLHHTVFFFIVIIFVFVMSALIYLINNFSIFNISICFLFFINLFFIFDSVDLYDFSFLAGPGLLGVGRDVVRSSVDLRGKKLFVLLKDYSGNISSVVYGEPVVFFTEYLYRKEMQSSKFHFKEIYDASDLMERDNTALLGSVFTHGFYTRIGPAGKQQIVWNTPFPLKFFAENHGIQNLSQLSRTKLTESALASLVKFDYVNAPVLDLVIDSELGCTLPVDVISDNIVNGFTVGELCGIINSRDNLRYSFSGLKNLGSNFVFNDIFSVLSKHNPVNPVQEMDSTIPYISNKKLPVGHLRNFFANDMLRFDMSYNVYFLGSNGTSFESISDCAGELKRHNVEAQRILSYKAEVTPYNQLVQTDVGRLISTRVQSGVRISIIVGDQDVSSSEISSVIKQVSKLSYGVFGPHIGLITSATGHDIYSGKNVANVHDNVIFPFDITQNHPDWINFDYTAGHLDTADLLDAVKAVSDVFTGGQ